MSKSKILIVEDDILIARDIEKILLSIEYSVSTIIPIGKRILSKIIDEKPDLVLMDIMFRDEVGGIDLARKLKERMDVPIVFLTGHSDKSILKKAKVTEPYGYLLKPVSEKELEITIEMVLYRHNIERNFKERMETALKESENRYRQLVENISEGIVMQDKRGVITYANDRFIDLIGFPKEQVIGKPITRFLAGGLLKKKDDQESGNGDGSKNISEISWKRKDGKKIFTILSPNPIYSEKGEHKGTVAVLTDITERRAVEKELHRSRELLRKLSHHLQEVRERESKRIAQEIHDELGQQLTALKMDLSWLSNRVDPQEEGAKRFLQKIDSMSGLVDNTIQTVQKISAELRPGLLDDLGLVPAVEWLAQEFENQTNIPCKLQFHCEMVNIDPDCSTAIFRISQEALTNISRHAEATRVEITLGEENNALVLKISDNGKGIKPEEVFGPSSLGLMGMRERVRAFGGDLKISGVPKKGTVLTVTLPYTSKDGA